MLAETVQMIPDAKKRLENAGKDLKNFVVIINISTKIYKLLNNWVKKDIMYIFNIIDDNNLYLYIFILMIFRQTTNPLD